MMPFSTRMGAFLRLPWRKRGDGSAFEETLKDVDKGSLSQLQLIRRAFGRHKLAMAGLWVLILLYGVALLAEFVAIAPPTRRDVQYLHCPPTPIRFNFDHGLHVRAMQPVLDDETLRRTYRPLPDVPVPLTFFAKTDEYKLLGLIPLEHRLIGIDTAELAERGELPQGVEPAFYPMGADQFGRDLYSRMCHGARVSLSVGLVGIALTFVLGTLVGGISGYAGGHVDNLIQRLIEIISAVPSLPLWIALAAAMPPSWSPLQTYFAITVVLSLLGWTGLARVVRGKILSLREEDYAIAARLMGASHGRVLVRHLLPGFASHIIVSLTLSVPGMILGETALSFLGLGLRPPVVSWGVLLQDCLDVKAVRFYPWLMLPAGLIVTTVLAFNFVGDGLRDAADPYATK